MNTNEKPSTASILFALAGVAVFFTFVYLALAAGAWYVSAYMVFTWLATISVLVDKNREIKQLRAIIAKVADE